MADTDPDPKSKALEDEESWLVAVATALLVAKIIALRGQPINNGDVTECAQNASAMLRALGQSARNGT